MSKRDALKSDDAILDAVLTPHRSLGGRGFALLMALFGTTCFATGLLFYVVGAWPVMGFFGLDVALLGLAFWLNYRAARAFEQVVVRPGMLVVRSVSARGRETTTELDPTWARLDVERHDEVGVTGLSLVSRGRRVSLGTFLNPADRESFARALGAALAKARGAT